MLIINSRDGVVLKPAQYSERGEGGASAERCLLLILLLLLLPRGCYLIHSQMEISHLTETIAGLSLSYMEIITFEKIYSCTHSSKEAINNSDVKFRHQP